MPLGVAFPNIETLVSLLRRTKEARHMYVPEIKVGSSEWFYRSDISNLKSTKCIQGETSRKGEK